MKSQSSSIPTATTRPYRSQRLPAQIFLTVLASLVWLTPLTAAPIQLPPLVVPASQEHHVGKIIFAELTTPDLAASKKFYSNLFGWTYLTTKVDTTEYAQATLNGRTVAGMLYKPLPPGAQRQPAWLSFIAVRDVAATKSQAMQLGAKTLFEPRSFPERGTEAVFADPQGAVFAVLASSSGDPADELARSGEWIWSSLITTDPETSAAFYQKLFDYEVFDLPPEQSAQHLILSTEDYARASVNTLPQTGHKMHSHWINYIRVDDTTKMAEKVVALGGRVLVEPRIDRHGGKVALVADPLGTPFGLLEWNDTDGQEESK